jgi:hypothetical protein
LVCRGPFFASPLIVASSDQGPGLEPKKRVCRNLSKGDSKAGIPAVNDYIDKADFPTRFDMPSKMADLVSHHFFLFSLSFCSRLRPRSTKGRALGNAPDAKPRSYSVHTGAVVHERFACTPRSRRTRPRAVVPLSARTAVVSSRDRWSFLDTRAPRPVSSHTR